MVPTIGPIGTPCRSRSIASSLNGMNGLNGVSAPGLHGLGTNGSHAFNNLNSFNGPNTCSSSSMGLGGSLNGHNSNSRFFSNGNSQVITAPSSVSDDDDLGEMWTAFANLKNEETSRLASKNALLEKALTSLAYLRQQNSELEKLLEQDRSRSSSVDNLYYEQAEMFRRMLERDVFILILIDGNGMIFDQELLRNGETGGRQAACLLRNTVDAWARSSLQQCPENFRIKARIFANVRGLAEMCHRANLATSPSIIEDFIRGFTTADDLFNFVDVGSAKDLVDRKMSAEFTTHVYNFQCRHILFGCSHNKGFAPMLEQYIHEPDVINRVTLVEGLPFGRELAALPYNTKRLDNVFRHENVIAHHDYLETDFPTRQDSRNSFNPTCGVFTPATQTLASDNPQSNLRTRTGFASPALSPSRALTRTSSYASSSTMVDSPNVVVPNGSTGGVGASSKWANIARGSAHLPYKDLVRPVLEPKPAGPVVRQNKFGQRIDIEMDYNHDKVFELKKQKYCNQHYIGKGCCHHEAGNGACPHKHDTKLSNEDLKWLRVVARETVCKKGTSCVDADCIYGHHCPYPKATEGSLRGAGCINGDNCRFSKDMHGMDQTVARTIRLDSL